MIKVLFVDDEILAMEYLKGMIDWEANGFTVVGLALTGKKALEIFDREKPQVVISDIKMSGMDGLELTRELKKRNPEAAVLLLSAYRDFEYAKKGIEYGVTNYLLKHELCEEKLLEELEKIRGKLAQGKRRKDIYQKYFAKQLIYHQTELSAEEEKELGNRFSLMLLQKNSLFRGGVFVEQEWTGEEKKGILEKLESSGEGVVYLAEEQLNAGHLVILYRIENMTSQYEVISSIERTARSLGDCLAELCGGTFNLIYSEEIRRGEISTVFQKMSRLVRGSAFWRPDGIYCMSRLPEPEEEEKISWNDKAGELKRMIREGDGRLEDYIGYLFDLTRLPRQNLRALRELVYVLENLLREVESQEGVVCEYGECGGCKIGDIQKYYAACAVTLADAIRAGENRKYSRLVQDIIRYIRKNYEKNLSLEALGTEFGMNGVYLGQMFKKETGVTFLKYVTNYRMEEAKRLLLEGSRNVSEVAELTGYPNSRYFSQIFLKNVGVSPQEYRRNGEQKAGK